MLPVRVLRSTPLFLHLCLVISKQPFSLLPCIVFQQQSASQAAAGQRCLLQFGAKLGLHLSAVLLFEVVVLH